MSEMTTKDIQILIGKDRVLAGHTCVCENVKYLLTAREMDVISVKSDKLWEYEVKISRSDFLADAKKKKNSFNGINGRLVQKWNPNYFYYVCPDGLIDISELPFFAGLYYATETGVSLIKKATFYNDFKHDIDGIKKTVLRIHQERNFLGACLMTYKNKEAVKRYNELLISEQKPDECDARDAEKITEP